MYLNSIVQVLKTKLGASSFRQLGFERRLLKSNKFLTCSTYYYIHENQIQIKIIRCNQLHKWSILNYCLLIWYQFYTPLPVLSNLLKLKYTWKITLILFQYLPTCATGINDKPKVLNSLRLFQSFAYINLIFSYLIDITLTLLATKRTSDDDGDNDEGVKFH